MNDIIETSNLNKSHGSKMRVKNLKLQVPEGCVYGFLGPNGAGKTTTLKLLLGLIKPDNGTISFYRQKNEKMLVRSLCFNLECFYIFQIAL